MAFHALEQVFVIQKPVVSLQQRIVDNETSAGRIIVPASGSEGVAHKHHGRHQLRKPLQGRDSTPDRQIDIGDSTGSKQREITRPAVKLDEKVPALNADEFTRMGTAGIAPESAVVPRVNRTERQTTQLPTKVPGFIADAISITS